MMKNEWMKKQTNQNEETYDQIKLVFDSSSYPWLIWVFIFFSLVFSLEVPKQTDKQTHKGLKQVHERLK